MALTKTKNTDERIFKYLKLTTGDNPGYIVVDSYTPQRQKDGSCYITVVVKSFVSEKRFIENYEYGQRKKLRFLIPTEYMKKNPEITYKTLYKYIECELLKNEIKPESINQQVISETVKDILKKEWKKNQIEKEEKEGEKFVPGEYKELSEEQIKKSSLFNKIQEDEVKKKEIERQGKVSELFKSYGIELYAQEEG